MNRSLSPSYEPAADLSAIFRRAVDAFGPEPILVLAHNDADGLSAGALLVRALRLCGRSTEARIVGRGENPWSEDMRRELSGRSIGGLIVADLGIRPGSIRQDTPTIIIDHHVPQGSGESATIISGFYMNPVPTSSVLAYRCAATLADVQALVWLAALGVIGDMAESYGFAELQQARAQYGITCLREATALINQARRSSSGDATAAFVLLMKASSPREIMTGQHPETALLLAAREEVKSELQRVRRVAPKVVGPIALIRFSSPCQIHPLIAQMWMARLKDRIVLAANVGFRAGWVHFAVRSAADIDLIEFLRQRAPAGADENYGSGHRKATGGALRVPQWNAFVSGLGFGPEMEVSE